MATVFDRGKARVLDIGLKVGYDDDPMRYILDPDLSAVDGWPQKYWVIGVHPDQTITLMNQAARDVVDVQDLSDSRDGAADQLDRVDDILRAFALVVLDEINVLRAEHSLSARTIAQLKAAVRGKLGS